MSLSIYRKAKGITQIELAKKLNVKQSTISMWETGVACPKITLIGKLALELGCTREEILDCINNKQEE